MTTPLRIQLSRAKGWKMPADTLKVDRTTAWGNPLVVGKHGTREECVRLLALTLNGQVVISMGQDDDGAYIADKLIAYRKHLLRSRRHLEGKNLACWCHLCAKHKAGKPWDEPCADCAPFHVDLLLQVANHQRRKVT